MRRGWLPWIDRAAERALHAALALALLLGSGGGGALAASQGALYAETGFSVIFCGGPPGDKAPSLGSEHCLLCVFAATSPPSDIVLIALSRRIAPAPAIERRPPAPRAAEAPWRARAPPA